MRPPETARKQRLRYLRARYESKIGDIQYLAQFESEELDGTYLSQIEHNVKCARRYLDQIREEAPRMRTPETQRVYHNGDWVRINGLSQNLHGQVGQIVSEPIPDYKGYAYRVQLSYEAVLVAHGRNLEPVEEQTATVCPTCGREVEG